MVVQYILDLADPSREQLAAEAGTNYLSTNGNRSTYSEDNTGANGGGHMIAAINNVVARVGAAAASENGTVDAKWYHEAIVDAVNVESSSYLRQLEAQSASYLRESRSSLGWRWTAGNKEGTLTYGWRLSGSSYIGNSGAEASFTSGGTKRLGLLDVSESVSLAPLPSENRARSHPAIKWQMRAEELKAVLDTGTPVNLPVLDGEEWFIIDATW